MKYLPLPVWVLFLLIASADARADHIVLDATARGTYWYSFRDGTFGASGGGLADGYLTGLYGGVLHRGYLAFDLPAFHGTIRSALLSFDLGSVGGPLPLLNNSFSVYNVTFDVPDLIGGTGGPMAFGRLGGGDLVAYGGFFPVAHAYLSSDRTLAELNHAKGGTLALGLSLNAYDYYASPDQFVFGGTDGGGARLILDVDTSVHTSPEPSSLTLLGLGAVGLAGCAWRRRLRNQAAA
jgi:PEP-CTERM motif